MNSAVTAKPRTGVGIPRQSLHGTSRWRIRLSLGQRMLATQLTTLLSIIRVQNELRLCTLPHSINVGIL